MLFALALTFLLGFAQQSALLHEISHLTNLDPISQEQSSQHTSSCDHCLSLSHFAHAVSSSFSFSPDAALSNKTTLFSSIQHFQRHSQAYTARAPPDLI